MLLRIVLAAALTLGSGLASASDGGVPALRVTAPNGNSSTLIGTLHVPYRGLVQPAPEVLDGRKRLGMVFKTPVAVATESRYYTL